jgi:type III pantothenate kinase
MILVLDVGNSNIVCGVFNDKKGDYALETTFRMSTLKNVTTDEYGIKLQSMLQSHGIKPKQITAAIFSSVVPSVNHNITKLMNVYFKKDIVLLNRTHFSDFSIHYDTPDDLGMDRLVNLKAAATLYGMPAMVVDFGTAVTIDVLDREKTYVGGMIFPGVAISLDSLISRTSKLPNVDLKYPSKLLGNSTKESMQNGLYYINTLGTEALIMRIKKEYFNEKEKISVVATGGLSKFIASNSDIINVVDTKLSLVGLKICLEEITH